MSDQAPINQTPDGHAPTLGLAGIARSLRRLRLVAKVQLVAQRTGTIVAAVLAIAVGAGLLDYLVRFPSGVRAVAWCVGLLMTLAALRQRVWPALRFTPTLTQLALRLERSPKGRHAGLEGLLASGLELGDRATTDGSRDANPAMTDQLRALAASAAALRFRALAGSAGLLRPARLWGAIGLLLAVGVPIAGLAVWRPQLASIGARRVFMPWTDQSWPKRTLLADPGHPAAHPIAAALPLRAALLATNRAPGQTEVVVSYRVKTKAGAGPTRRMELTPQHRTIMVRAARGGGGGGGRGDGAGGGQGGVGVDTDEVSGELFERLLDLSADVPAALKGEVRRAEVEYSFETADDSTAPATIVLVDPPALEHATVEVAPPDYAAAMLAALPRDAAPFLSGAHDAGTGLDQRAGVGPVLAGSRVVLRLTLNKPVPTPPPDDQRALAQSVTAFLARTMPGVEQAARLTVNLIGREWIVGFDAAAPARIPVQLRDEFGITSADDAALRLDVIEDRPPVAAIVDPPQDESVLATAVVDATAEGRDDVGLIDASLLVQPARAPADSAGAPPEGQGDPTPLATATPDPALPTTARAAAPIDLTTFKLAAGDELWLTGVARDLLSAADVSRRPVVSSKRRLRIISESELVEQVRAELSGLREAGKRLVEEQERLSSRRAAAVAEPDAAREQSTRQAGVADRLGPMSQAMDRLKQRLDRNKLDDPGLKGLLDDASQSVNDAREGADKAAASLEKLSAGARTPDDARAQGDSLRQAQEQAEQALARLVSMLDRGEDTWAVRRTIERLLTDQKQLRSQTAAAGAASQGLSPEQLTQQQREDLERVARRQKELAERSAAAIEQLAQRAQQMAKTDPSQSQAMQNAAQQARNAQLDAVQRNAGKQIEQNKTQQAQESQQQAEKALADALQELDKSEQKRDEALRRLLADVTESLRRLVTQQAEELARNARALAGEQLAGLDEGMIAVNRNTLGVRDQVAEQIEQAQTLLSILGAATSAQSAAIKSLRAGELAEADGNERVSLARLKDAVAEVEKMESDAAKRDDDRKRNELRKGYREALELQVALAAETAPFVDKEITRRDRPKVRSLGEKQEELRQRLEQMRSATEEIADAPVVGFAHDRLDRDMRTAATALTSGEAPGRVARAQEAAIRVLQSLVDALGDPPKRDDAFRDNENGGGGGGAGSGGKQPLIPPIMQLRLLRATQDEAMGRTRSLDDAGDRADADEIADLVQLQSRLAQQAKALMEQLKKQQAPGHDLPDGKGGPTEPADKGDAPEPDQPKEKP